MAEAGTPKFGYRRLLKEVGLILGAAASSGGSDRRIVLAALRRKLDVDDAVLLRRGFDKAYRQIVEGV